jgi:BA14K-like protein
MPSMLPPMSPLWRMKSTKVCGPARSFFEVSNDNSGNSAMRVFCVVISVCVLSSLSRPVLADAQAYCGLFGRDYADGRTLELDQWQISYSNAFNSCMTQYTSGYPGPRIESAEKIVKVADTPRRKRTTHLAPRSVAWNEYCAAKYTSFNKATGKYKSHSGKAKPCLVSSG